MDFRMSAATDPTVMSDWDLEKRNEWFHYHTHAFQIRSGNVWEIHSHTASAIIWCAENDFGRSGMHTVLMSSRQTSSTHSSMSYFWYCRNNLLLRQSLSLLLCISSLAMSWGTTSYDWQLIYF